MDRDDELLGGARPRLRLATLPTPLERAERFEAALRASGAPGVPRIYLKRDDLLSLGMGGNKIRNLEFLIGAALAEGATDVVTAGRQQSNHCRLTAAACARAGLRAHLVLSGDEPRTYTGNLLLDRVLGADLHFVGGPPDDRDARTAKVAKIGERIRASGGRPYIIAVGGSNIAGVLGHVLAAAELHQQLAALGEPASAIVLATATGGTQAGLLAGLRKLGLPTPVLGFAVAKAAEDLRLDVSRLCDGTTIEIASTALDPNEIVVDGSQLGAGYGVPSAAGQAAIELLARSEGVLADPVYTGKALAGLIARARAGGYRADECVVFIHTGGLPALFADLPATRT